MASSCQMLRVLSHSDRRRGRHQEGRKSPSARLENGGKNILAGTASRSAAKMMCVLLPCLQRHLPPSPGLQTQGCLEDNLPAVPVV
ncbi:unnamed protein product [Lampetra fluviatilis]